MKYKTLCRNPKCLKPINGETPVKLYCDDKCKMASSDYWRELSANPAIDEEQQHAIVLEYEEKFIAEFEKHYESPCFGIETEYG